MRVLAAPDKFRGSLAAEEVCAAIARAVEPLAGECIRRPMSDGGEGLLAAFGGPDRASSVTGPAGTPVPARWLLRPDGTAVLESAEACGLVLAGGAAGNDPVAATSRGVGELVVAAVAAGCDRILLGLGGSATTDGGSAAVEAICAAFGDRLPVSVTVCCDVRTRFLDAAEVFGPQKGADPATVALLADRLREQRAGYRRRFGRDPQSVDGTGAAGGLAGGLWAIGAELVSGFDLVAAELDLAGLMAGCDLVVTGEGRFDAGSLAGKVVGGVARLAAAAGVPSLVVAGAAEPVVLDPALGATVVGLLDRFGEAAAWQRTADCITEVVAEQLRGMAR